MEVKVKVPFEGETADADDIDFRVLSAVPCEYELGDGTKVRVFHEVKKIYKLCGRTKADGSPIYILIGQVQTQIDLRVSTGEAV